MNRRSWDDLAAWRDERMGEQGDLWHRALIDPAVRAMLGSVRDRRVLDVGCGNGYLTRRLRREGAARSVGIDASAASIRIARRRETARPTGAEFHRADASRLASFGSGSFDRIVANMSLMDIRDGAGVVREMGRLLAPGGRLVFSINHPCFDIDERSEWGVDRRSGRVFRKIEGYRRERPVLVPWRGAEDEVVYTTAYHRTLSTYMGYLRDAGLAILRLSEPAPRAEFRRASPQGRFVAEIPLHLVVEAAPWPGPAEPTGRGARSGRDRRRRRKRPG